MSKYSKPYNKPNRFFNNFTNSGEQDLLENLIMEYISTYGQQMIYVPRDIINFDKIYTTDDQSSYTKAIPIMIYIDSFDGFQGDGEYMKQFGDEIRNTVSLTVAQKIFREEVSALTGQDRPNEGDIIYFPLNDRVFQITFVQKYEMFYQLGKLYTWQMVLEMFEYSNETFATGIPSLDRIQKLESTNQLDFLLFNENGSSMLTENGDYITIAPNMEKQLPDTINQEVFNQANTFLDWDITNPFSEDGKTI